MIAPEEGERRSALPLIVRPHAIGARSAGKAELIEWLHHSRSRWRSDLHAHGALLFRGFADVRRAEDFEEVATAVSPALMDYVGGVAPRRPVRGQVTMASEAPPEQAIRQHQEMSYTTPYPDFVMFFCERAAEVGGQTPLTDMRTVTARLPADLVAEFESRGLRLIRELGERARASASKVWPEVFGTGDRAEVERLAARRGWSVEWLGRGRMRLAQEIRPAIVIHPRDGERVWFNSAHLYFGEARWPALRRRLGTIVFADVATAAYVFGDDGAIPESRLRTIHRTIASATRTFDWHSGDLLLIDNVLVSHGRLPYRGSRRILAALLREAGV